MTDWVYSVLAVAFFLTYTGGLAYLINWAHQQRLRANEAEAKLALLKIKFQLIIDKNKEDGKIL